MQDKRPSMLRARALFGVVRVLTWCRCDRAARRVQHHASVAWVTALKGKAWVEARR